MEFKNFEPIYKSTQRRDKMNNFKQLFRRPRGQHVRRPRGQHVRLPSPYFQPKN